MATSKAASAPGLVVVDLPDVAFIDSSGIDALVRLRARAGATNEAVTLRNAHPFVARTLEVVGVPPSFVMEPNP